MPGVKAAQPGGRPGGVDGVDGVEYSKSRRRKVSSY
jgi:hypothetical protein